MKTLKDNLLADKDIKMLALILDNITKARADEMEKDGSEKSAKALAKAKVDLQILRRKLYSHLCEKKMRKHWRSCHDRLLLCKVER